MAATNDGRAVEGGPAQPVYITNATGDPVPTTGGGGGGGGGGAVTIADGADITQGAKADAAASTDAGTFSLVALFKRLLGKITAGLGVVPVNSALFTGSAAALNADILVDTDATLYRSVSIQLTGTWSATVSPQVSIDGSTSWNNVVGTNVQSNAQVITLTSNGIYAFSLPAGARFRLRATAYTSGTANGTVIFSSTPMAFPTVTILPGNTIAVSATQLPAALAANGGLKIEGVASGVAVPIGGTIASGAADSGNPVKVGGKYNATLPTHTDGNRADAQSDINGFTRVATAATLVKTATPTVSTSPAYSSGDSIGGLISLTSAVRYAAGGGTITSVVISDKAKQSAAIDVIFFTANPGSTTFTDNAALAVNAADLISIVGVISVTTYSAFSANSVGSALGQSLPFVLASGTTLYAALVSRGTPTYASTSDIQLTVGILPD